MTALKPCPFCGDVCSPNDDGDPMVYYTRDLKYRYCECDNCGARTMDCDTEQHAITAWNTRANEQQGGE